MNTFTSVSKSALSVSVSVFNMVAHEAMFHMTSEEGHRAHDCAMEVLSVVGLLALEAADSAARFTHKAATDAALNAWDVAGNGYYTKSFVHTLNTAWAVANPIWDFNARAFQAFLGLTIYTAAFAAAWIKVNCDNVVESSLEGAELYSFFAEAHSNEPEEFPVVEPMVKCAVASGTIVRSWVTPAPLTGVAAENAALFCMAFLAVEGGYSTLNEYEAVLNGEVA